jgi:hypothetical protein
MAGLAHAETRAILASQALSGPADSPGMTSVHWLGGAVVVPVAEPVPVGLAVLVLVVPLPPPGVPLSVLVAEEVPVAVLQSPVTVEPGIGSGAGFTARQSQTSVVAPTTAPRPPEPQAARTQLKASAVIADWVAGTQEQRKSVAEQPFLTDA